MSRFLAILLCLVFLNPWSLWAAKAPKVAIADLAHEKGMEETMQQVAELRNFASELKNTLLKSGIKTIRGKPHSEKGNATLDDMMDRIKQDQFAGADLVVFGTVSSIEFGNKANATIIPSEFSTPLNLELVVYVRLIDTKTQQISLAFTAMGEGWHAQPKATLDDDLLPPDRGQVIAQAIRSLVDDVASQLAAHLETEPAK